MSNLASRAAGAYLHANVQARSPLELVVMLYEGAIRFASAARTAIQRHDIPARRDALSRAMAIVSELQSTLDLERGGAIAESLDRLYRYITDRFMEAAFRHDPAPLDEAIALLTTLCEAWASIAREAPADLARVAR